MNSGLIGFSGFVGSTLLKQTSFKLLYRSTNIDEIEGKTFKTIVCAGASAQKWIANREPATDRQQIDGLIARLTTVKCHTFILISTVDVFKHPVRVEEETVVTEAGLHPYGLHRYRLERFVENYFPKHLIIRLPGLVGPGLRKNIIFDFLHNNNLRIIDSRSIFQFYPMVNLWYDIQTALKAGLRLVHLTAAPISVAEVSRQGFGKPFDQKLLGVPASYDVRSRHAAVFGSPGDYQYSARESIQAIRSYAQSELVTLLTAAGTSA